MPVDFLFSSSHIIKDFPYHHVLVIGSPGSGKSTLSRKLGDILDLPVIHLDLLWHLPDQTTVSEEVFDKRLMTELNKPCWIIDGNFLRTVPLRLEKADLVLFLDYPAALCEESVEERIGKPRLDLPWIEQSFDPEFRIFIQEFPIIRRPAILDLLSKVNPAKTTVVQLTSREEADQFMDLLKELTTKAVSNPCRRSEKEIID
ncbi:adenylate kinase [Erysipelotrichaceae bacterium RD49]|nr:adenylate kinase [Erysipelotrichaceae bacterium RD49]